MSHICANQADRSQVDATNRPENIVIRYVSFVSLLSVCVYLNLKVVDVFIYKFFIGLCKVTAYKRIEHLY
jgi:hypothetical protein